MSANNRRPELPWPQRPILKSQRMILRNLGHPNIPATRGEASELIISTKRERLGEANHAAATYRTLTADGRAHLAGQRKQEKSRNRASTKKKRRYAKQQMSLEARKRLDRITQAKALAKGRMAGETGL